MLQPLVHISRLPRFRPRYMFGALGAFILVAGADPSILSSLPSAGHEESVVYRPSLSGLGVLSASDQGYYREAFRLQQMKQYHEADSEIQKVRDPILKPDLLAERYLTTDYAVREDELRDWLKVNAEHPQASALYHLALKLNMTLPTVAAHGATIISKMAANSYEKSGLRETANYQWTQGLNSYRKQDMAEALEHFKSLLNKEDGLSGHDRAAVAFWAYRSAMALGNKTEAFAFAQEAAKQPPGFYSILARHVVTTGPNQMEQAQTQVQTMTPMLTQTTVRHAIALKEIGQDARAEQELRGLFATSEDEQRKQLIELAQLLDLPSAQMHMALDYAQSGDEAHDLLYPMPNWKPTSGYRIEPALLYAIMRQESGFNPKAHSPSGATGVMQLMPATAHEMARSERIIGRNSSLPSVSMALGQSYLEHLMDTASIGDNLVYLTAAYNAGPGKVDSWQHSLHCNNDPLLFIESIPYEETHEYVIRVIGNYWVYSDLFGGHDTTSAASLAEGKWPRYAGVTQQLSTMLSHLGSNELE